MTDTPGRPGRPRSAAAEQAILRATVAEVAEVGIRALSVERVAARAGVGKATVYRRWPAKDALVAAAVRSVQAGMPVRDTGYLREDLREMYRTALHAVRSAPMVRALYLRLLSERDADPELFATFTDQLVRPRLQQLTDLVDGGRRRGEIRSDLDPAMVVDVVVGPALVRWLTGDLPGRAGEDPDVTAAALADLVMDLLSPTQRKD